MLRLVLLADDGGSGREIPVEGPVTIGRGDDATVVVADHSLSRLHARVEVSGARLLLRDLGSRNGTFVNGQKIDRREVSAGDRIQCGRVIFEVSDDAEPQMVAKALLSLPQGSARRPISTLDANAARAQTLGKAPGDTPERVKEKLELLLKVSTVLSSPEPIDALLQKILDLLFEILDVTRGVVLLLDDEPAPASAAPADALTTGPTQRPRERSLVQRAVKSRAAPGGVETPLYSQRIARYVLEKGVAGLFRDALVDGRFDAGASIVAQSIRAAMCVPLRPRDEILGVIYVDNLTTPNLFSEGDLALLVAFANQAAIAIENATLYRKIEDAAVLRNNLVRFFPPATVRKLAESPSLETIDAEVTAVFADMSNYTRMSSTMEPRRVVELLNEYFPAMADIVFRHEGTLEKYIGDALLAVWGAPFSHPDDATRAVQAAMEMHRTVMALNKRWARAGRPTVQVHIGVNTGPVAAGNIGSMQYLQYATIGDATNLASRVCNVAAEGELVISRATLAKARGLDAIAEALPPVRVKGKDEPLELYRVRWS